MSDLLALYARMFLIGIAVAAPVGAMGVLCIQRTLSRGWRTGIATGLGVATADGIYAALAAFGMSALSGAIVAWQTPLRLVGGVALVVLGVRAALAAPRSCAAETPASLDPAGAAQLYASAVGLTLTNPMTIMAFGAIFAGAGLSTQPGALNAAVATVGVASGSLSWWLVLVTGVALARHAVGPRLLRGINVGSGVVVAVFGVIAVTSVFIN
jgi:threonine/homoserine/homoserine lactone efflux protein